MGKAGKSTLSEETLTGAEADRIAANKPAVTALYERCALLDFARRAYFEPWQIYAFGCLARAHCALDSVFVLGPEREADTAALTRVLYEHVVSFAWLMIDPPSHYKRLMKWEHAQRQKMHADSASFVTTGPSADQLTLIMISDGLDASAVEAPPTPVRAEQADAYWTPRVPGYTFYLRHSFATLFRAHSASVHPTLMGILPFCDIRPGAQFRTPPARMLKLRLDTEALVVFADALLVASATFGWPKAEEVLLATFDGFDLEQIAGIAREPERKSDG